MIRKIGKSVDSRFQTYYNKTYEDQGQVFIQPSLTDQSYFMENDIYTLLAQGCANNGALVYGDQDFTTLEELENVKRDYLSSWNKLSLHDKLSYGDFRSYVSYVSDIRNYPSILPENSSPVVDSSSEVVVENNGGSSE